MKLIKSLIYEYGFQAVFEVHHRELMTRYGGRPLILSIPREPTMPTKLYSSLPPFRRPANNDCTGRWEVDDSIAVAHPEQTPGQFLKHYFHMAGVEWPR